METLIYQKIDKFQDRTLEAVTDQEVIMTEEEALNADLDKINLIKNGLSGLIPEFQYLLQEVVNTIPLFEKRGLIHLRNKIESLYNSTKKLTRSLSTGKYASAYNSVLAEYDVLNSDLYEIITDLDKKTKSNKEINSLLDEFADF